MKKWPPVMMPRNLSRSAPTSRTAPRSAAVLLNGGSVGRAARAGEICHFNFLRVELRRGLGHAVHRLIEAERSGVFGPEAQRVDARDDEAPEIRAGEAFGLERFDLFYHQIVEFEERF